MWIIFFGQFSHKNIFILIIVYLQQRSKSTLCDINFYQKIISQNYPIVLDKILCYNKSMAKALIVIDVQNFFLGKKTKSIVAKIAQYLEQHSRDYSRIFFTVFKNDQNSPLWQIAKWHGCQGVPDTNICAPLKKFTNKQNLFYKNILSAAKVPAINRWLNQNHVNELHLCGFDTDCCILSTTYDLFDQKIKPIILENLCWSTAKEKLHRPAIKMIQRNIGFTQQV